MKEGSSLSKRTRPALITRNDLMAEWDSEANTNLDPAKITEGSGQKINLMCGRRLFGKGPKQGKDVHFVPAGGVRHKTIRRLITTIYWDDFIF